MAEGNGRNTVPGMIADVSRTVVTTLPAQFLVLVFLNCIFIGGILWFLDSREDRRSAIISKLLDRCMEIALQHEPPR